MTITRRNFLQLVSLGAAAVAVEPVQRIWQVGVQLETSACPRKWWHDIKYDRNFTPAANTYFQDKYAHSDDPHSTLAADLMRLPVEQAVLRPEFARYRNAAKTWNFGLHYGASGADWAKMLQQARLIG
jgi:hypothetical protein